MATDTTSNKRRLLRLSGIQTTDIPSPSAPAEELRPFLTALLEEAIPFIDSAAPRGGNGDDDNNHTLLWKSKGVKKFTESDAPVELSEVVVPLTAGESSSSSSSSYSTETWACRRSVHVDAAVRGTASWAEFVECIRDRHVETEDAFTPTVLGHQVVATWPSASDVVILSPPSSSSSSTAAAAASSSPSSSWSGFQMSIVEMKHKIPPPLKPRVFPVLQVIGSITMQDAHGDEEEEFIVISVTVNDLETGGGGSFKEQNNKVLLSGEKGIVVGAYASVERVRLLSPSSSSSSSSSSPPPGETTTATTTTTTTTTTGTIEWVMATASDAKGVLPMWMQTKAVPGQIAKDVSLFLGWVHGQRG